MEANNLVSKVSVQSLYIEMDFERSKLAKGTAFVMNSAAGPVMVTNRHNVTGRRQNTDEPMSPTGGIPSHISILHNSAEKLFQWTWRREPLYDIEGIPLWREHPTLGGRADFVALPLTQLEGVQLFPHQFEPQGHDFPIAPADPVSVVGFPFGLAAGGAFGVWATGFLASEPAINYNGLPIQLIDCRTRPGQSGSPVIAFRGSGVFLGHSLVRGPIWRFIGIYSGRINEESDLGTVWKASAIKDLIQSM